MQKQAAVTTLLEWHLYYSNYLPGYIDCMRLLLEYGANGTSRMDMQWTPAHCAAEAGRLNAIRALHGAGIPIDKKDKYGDTPRRIAEIYGHKDVVAFLIL